MTLSEAMIAAADALRAGVAEQLVASALYSDGVPTERIDTIMRWCKLYNQRRCDEPSPIEDDQGSFGAYQDDLH